MHIIMSDIGYPIALEYRRALLVREQMRRVVTPDVKVQERSSSASENGLGREALHTTKEGGPQKARSVFLPP
jgi:hypothetical protein